MNERTIHTAAHAMAAFFANNTSQTGDIFLVAHHFEVTCRQRTISTRGILMFIGSFKGERQITVMMVAVSGAFQPAPHKIKNCFKTEICSQYTT